MLYHAGDTGLFGDMSLIGRAGIDVALLPIGDKFTMGPDDAVSAVELLHPRLAVPMHYNTFPVIEQDAEAWKRAVETLTGTPVTVMHPGDSIEVTLTRERTRSRALHRAGAAALGAALEANRV